MSQSKGEQVARDLRAAVEFREEHDSHRSGTFAHVTVEDVTSVGFDIEDALRQILNAAVAVRRAGLDDDSPSVFQARQDIVDTMRTAKASEAAIDTVLHYVDTALVSVCDEIAYQFERNALADVGEGKKAAEKVAAQLRAHALRFRQAKES